MKYVVTIARTYGSGGKEIGKLLAKELGIKYYGREIFLKCHKGLRVIWIPAMMKVFIMHLLKEADELFKQQSKTIRENAEKESCVIVGRCADYVLRDMDNVVKIYLYAPIRDCMRRVIRLYELNRRCKKSYSFDEQDKR